MLSTKILRTYCSYNNGFTSLPVHYDELDTQITIWMYNAHSKEGFI